VLFFKTQVQQDVFFGHMLKKTVFNHQTIDLAYMSNQAVMADLVPRFESMGLNNFFQHRCDWNETIIRQFHATLEIDLVEEKLWWNTRKRTYYATFAQFAAANELNYEFLTAEDSVNIMMENPMDENDYPMFYESARSGIRRSFGKTHGLKHHPAVINKIARVTFMPKSGNKDKVRGLYWNVISHVMNGDKINIIALIMDQMAELRLNLEMNLYFAPYIMSIIKAKTNFRGPCECKHTPFRPFKNETAFLQRPLTPFPPEPEPESEPEGDENENEGDAPDMGGDAQQQPMLPPPPPMQQQWAPPA